MHSSTDCVVNCLLTAINKSHVTIGKEPSTQKTGTRLHSFHSEYLTLLLTALIVVRWGQKKLLKPRNWIDNLPGPRTYPIVGGLLYFSADLTRTFDILLNWSKKFGPIFRSEGLFNEPFIFLNNAQHVQAVLTSNHLGMVSKPRIPYDNLFGQFLKNGLLISKGDHWKSHRRIMSRAFTYKAFNGHARIFNEHSRCLVNDLEKLFSGHKKDQPREISELIHCASLQIICKSVMGLDLQGSKDGIVFNEKFQRYKIISSQRASHFWFLIDFFWKLHPISREYTRIINTLNGITREVIENSKKNNNNLEKCIRKASNSSQAEENEDDNEVGARVHRSMIDEMWASGMTPEEILIEANTVIVAGFESTSLTIHFLLFLLALNREQQRLCQQEVDEMFNDPVKCQDENLTVDALFEMKYLERCCLETLRLFPVIFVFQRRPEVAVKLDDKHEIPAGMNLVIPIYNLHRNPEYFPEPNKFDPDRFLPENIQSRHPYAFIPFSSGIRNCIGYKFALLEIKAVAAHILRNFDISTVDKIDDVPILPSIVMTPARDYKFILKRRCV